MPLEHLQIEGEASEDRVVLGLLRTGTRGSRPARAPAPLYTRAPSEDARSCEPRRIAEVRQPRRDRLTDRPLLIDEPGMDGLLVDAHAAAHHHQEVEVARVGQRAPAGPIGCARRRPLDPPGCRRRCPRGSSAGARARARAWVTPSCSRPSTPPGLHPVPVLAAGHSAWGGDPACEQWLRHPATSSGALGMRWTRSR